jgi:hypothetical protein
MLIFFDETFRQSRKYPGVTLGALCGVGIPEKDLGRIADDVFKLKMKHMGSEFARNREIKGKELLKDWIFRLMDKGVISRNYALAADLVNYIVTRRLPIFGCVCFDQGLQKFSVDDVSALDRTFRYLFERIDTFMKIHRRDELATLVFDDRDFGINQKNAEAITNFFQRSAYGLSLDSIVKTPFFAISQSNNVGLQLADVITAVIGMRFSSHPAIGGLFGALKKATVNWQSEDGHWISTVKVMRIPGKENAPGDPKVRGRDKKAQLPAQCEDQPPQGETQGQK